MLLVDFLRSVYESSVDEIPTDINVDQLWHEIEHYDVAAQVYHLLRNRDLLGVIPVELRNRLKTECDLVLFNNMFIRAEQSKLLERFDEAGIPVILLKGLRFAERYFGHFAARGTSDIDLLILPEDLERAASTMSERGFYKLEDEEKHHFHILFNKDFPNAKFEYLGAELHWGLLRSHISDTHMNPIWGTSQPLGAYQHVRELSPEQTFYHICMHGHNHQLLGLKYVLDIAHLLYTMPERIHYDELFAQAKLDGNFNKMLIVLTHVYELFPSLQAIKPLPANRRWPFWSMALAYDAMIGLKSMNYYLFRLCSSFVTHESWKHRLADIRSSWFPARDSASKQLIKERDRSWKAYLKLYANRIKLLRRTSQSQSKAKYKESCR